MKKILFAALTIMLISSCSKKDETPSVVYTKVSVTKMTITSFPAGDASGYNWDNSLNGTYPVNTTQTDPLSPFQIDPLKTDVTFHHHWV